MKIPEVDRAVTALALRLFSFVLICSVGMIASAQWVTSGADITNTNAGNVGIGTTAPVAKLSVEGDSLVSKRFSGQTSLSFGTQGGGSQFVVGFQNELAYWQQRGGTITMTSTGGAVPTGAVNLVTPGCSGPCASDITFTSPGTVTYEFTGLGVFNVMSHRSWSAYLQMRSGQAPSRILVELLHADGTWRAMLDNEAPEYRLGLFLSNPKSDPFGDATDPHGVRFTLTFASTSASRIRSIGFYHQNRAFGSYTFPFLHAANTYTGTNIFSGPFSVTGKVGVGTTAPVAAVHAMGATTQFLRVEATNPDQNVGLQMVNDARAWQMYVSGTDADKLHIRDSTGSKNRLTIDTSGRVGINTETPAVAFQVVGDATFSGTVTGGNIKAKFQDIAEWVPSTSDLAPATVVVLNPTGTNEVMPAHRPYDTTVAGVVSAQPGLSLGEEGPGMEQIATTGRVKVRVDARRLPVRVGDLLVTGELPGSAIRSVPLTVQGVEMHRPGTIIGKALEPLAGGVGEILVLLSLQ